jgi:hypothetical protein
MDEDWGPPEDSTASAIRSKAKAKTKTKAKAKAKDTATTPKTKVKATTAKTKAKATTAKTKAKATAPKTQAKATAKTTRARCKALPSTKVWAVLLLYLADPAPACVICMVGPPPRDLGQGVLCSTPACPSHCCIRSPGGYHVLAGGQLMGRHGSQKVPLVCQAPEDAMTIESSRPFGPTFEDKEFLVGSDCSGLCTDVFALKAVTNNAIKAVFASETVPSLRLVSDRRGHRLKRLGCKEVSVNRNAEQKHRLQNRPRG